MNILKNAGTFEILTPIDFLQSQLKIIESAGRECYKSHRGEITIETAKKFIWKNLLRTNHESVLEHSIMTVRFEFGSRGFTHEQVRHRLTAISQESTRYVDYVKGEDNPDLNRFQLNCVIPPHKDENEVIDLGNGKTLTLREMFQQYELFYRSLRKAGWEPEDARQLLPIGIVSGIVISANFSEWRHIFTMRATKRAHWEIRKLITDLLRFTKPILSPVFDDFQEEGVCKKGVAYFVKIRDFFND